MQLGYIRTINWYDLVNSLTSSFGLITFELFSLQKPFTTHKTIKIVLFKRDHCSLYLEIDILSS